MIQRIIGFVALSLFLHGCMSSAPQKDDYSNTDFTKPLILKRCCIESKSINVVRLQGNEANFTLKENGEKIRLNGASHSYYAIEIPNIDGEAKYKLSSFFGKNESDRNVTLPIAWILDEKFNVTRKSTLRMVGYRPWSIWNQEHFYLHLRTDSRRYPNEKYILITSDSDTVGKNIFYEQGSRTIHVPVIAGNSIAGFAPHSKGGRKFTFTSAGSGQLHLELITNPMSKPFDRFIYF